LEEIPLGNIDGNGRQIVANAPLVNLPFRHFVFLINGQVVFRILLLETCVKPNVEVILHSAAVIDERILNHCDYLFFDILDQAVALDGFSQPPYLIKKGGLYLP